MKKILTAIGTPELNNCLKEVNEFEIISNDIIYQEGIFEILEEKEVDILILSELLKGDNSLKELLRKIKQKQENIVIILLLEKKDEEKIKIAQEEKVEKIMYHHKISFQEMISLIKSISTTSNLEEEIKNLKALILDNSTKKKSSIINNLKSKIIKKKENIKINKTKIIAITGNPGVGKSLISTCIAFELNNKKILLLDFDLINQSINTILGKKIIRHKWKKIMPLKYDKLKISKNIDFISCSNFLSLNNDEKNIKEINELFENIKYKYDLIIIDTSSNININYTKLILQKADIILFLTEGNLVEIKKSINMLDFFINEWHIENNKINIVFNKYNKNSIDEKILKHIFIDFNILGKINYNCNYSLMINRNMQNYFMQFKEKKQYKKIVEKIIL